MSFVNTGLRLLAETFRPVEDGHVKPIHSIRIFDFDEVIAALSHVRRGQQIGKIVVSHEGQNDVKLPIQPATRRLRLLPNAFYLIVGDLKGLCKSLAVFMARHGARRLIVTSRSGLNNGESFKVIEDCTACGCAVQQAKGDICDFEFVRCIFASSESHPIALRGSTGHGSQGKLQLCSVKKAVKSSQSDRTSSSR